jgi:hypothetical protein
MHATTICMHRSNLKRRILEAVVTYQHYLQVKEELQQEKIQPKYKEYKLEDDGISMHKNIVHVPSSN